MPDRDPEAPHNARLLTALIWAGVGLAPVAALVVLLGGSDSSIRFAVLLIAVSVVLIGAALLVRHDPVLLSMEVENQLEALREEVTASAHATGNRVRALQDEMTRMRAAGSPAMGLPPAGARAAAPVGAPPVGGRAGVAAPVMNEPGHLTGGRASAGVREVGHTTGGRVMPVSAGAAGYPVNGRASAAVPGRAVAGQARADGWAPDADRGDAPAPPGRPAVATASVAPPDGHTSVARIPTVAAAAAPVTGSASVGSAALRPVASGAAAAAPLPRQRAAAVVPPPGGGYGRDDDAAEPRSSGGYGPGLSGSAWAERSGGADHYGTAEAAPPAAEQRPSRRHAAPDTGTDLARYGLGAPTTPPPAKTYGPPEGYGAAEGYGTVAPQAYGLGSPAAPAPQTYGARPAPRTYGAEPEFQSYGVGPETYGTDYGFDRTGGYDYNVSHDQPAPSAYGIETSSFFADADETDADETDDHTTTGRGGEDKPGYGPDPLAPQHGWAPRSQERPGRW
ncbi:hypothetical protein [Actinoplanes sp. NPDC049599]|uniref:hypothetical protein n=1 Tax=Actinoplanes sp. NPDC049599 TaxID=3363903 RepID=UPI0037A29785